jgi:anaerobic selenocysteine-containing dehydrogenase
MKKISRRTFLKTSALTAGASLTAPMWLPRAASSQGGDATARACTDYSATGIWCRDRAIQTDA